MLFLHVMNLTINMAIARMRDEGIIITTTEMAMCELLRTADHPKFKEIIVYQKVVVMRRLWMQFKTEVDDLLHETRVFEASFFIS